MKGSIIKNKNKGGNVTFSVYVDSKMGEDGKRRQRKQTFDTRKEADEALTKMLMEAGGFVPPDKLTMNLLFNRYLEAAARKLKPTSLQTRTYQLERWRPIIGNIPLGKLSAMDIELGLGTLEKRLSASTVLETFASLRTTLRQAVRWNLIARDPSAGVMAPTVPRKEMRTWTVEQADRFLFRAKERSKHYPLFALALASGMRLGELLALRWEDLDLEAGAVMVRRGIAWVKGGYIFQEPKTASSRRRIPFDNKIQGVMKTHRKRQLEIRLAAGPAWKGQGLVFTTWHGGPLRETFARRIQSAMAKAAGVPDIRFHDLRHTHATTLLLSATHVVPVKVVAERLGHASTKTTLDTYCHVTQTMQETAIKALEDMFRY